MIPSSIVFAPAQARRASGIGPVAEEPVGDVEHALAGVWQRIGTAGDGVVEEPRRHGGLRHPGRRGRCPASSPCHLAPLPVARRPPDATRHTVDGVSNGRGVPISELAYGLILGGMDR